MGLGGEIVLVEIDTTVRKLAEGSLLLDLGGLLGVLVETLAYLLG